MTDRHDHTNPNLPRDLPPELASVERALDALGQSDRADAPPELADRALLRTRSIIESNRAAQSNAAPMTEAKPSALMRVAASLAIAVTLGLATWLSLPAATAPNDQGLDSAQLTAIAFSFDEWIMSDDSLAGDDLGDSIRTLQSDLRELESNEPDALDPDDEELVL